MLNTVAIYSKDNNSRTIEGVNRLIREFCGRGINIDIHRKVSDQFTCKGSGIVTRYSYSEKLAGKPDLVLSVGGDGTFLETVLKVRKEVPVAGVNTGRMGFLANIPEDDIGNSIDMLCNGEFETVDRSVIAVARPADLFGDETASALNEVTIQKADPGMITIQVYIDGIYLNTYWADGLIVSTATGSTAYNLSVGGPILTPDDESLIISPISPHNLTIRPIVVSGDSNLRMVVDGRSNEYLATCDFRSKRLPFSEEIHILRRPEKLKTVNLKGRDFYSTLRNKLMWGADRRN